MLFRSITRVRKLARDLRVCDERVPVLRLLECLIMGMDDKYDTLMSNLNVRTNLTENDYTSSMLSEESRLSVYGQLPEEPRELLQDDLQQSPRRDDRGRDDRDRDRERDRERDRREKDDRERDREREREREQREREERVRDRERDRSRSPRRDRYGGAHDDGR